MPEGPETHYIADRLGAALVGEALIDVAFAPPELAMQARKLRGRRIESIIARGKALLTRFDSGLTLYTHSQLLGYWRIERARSAPRATGTPRVLLATADVRVTLHIAPKVELWPSARVDEQPYLAKLGPDVLDPQVAAADFVARLREKRFVRTSLPALLLKQAFAAGMGNYLRSEVLFAAALSPHRRTGELDDDQVFCLAHALVDVPRRAYRAKFKRGDRAIGKAALEKEYLKASKATFDFHVFEREGERCGRCGDRIRLERLASRRLYWSPGCQR